MISLYFEWQTLNDVTRISGKLRLPENGPLLGRYTLGEKGHATMGEETNENDRVISVYIERETNFDYVKAFTLYI